MRKLRLLKVVVQPVFAVDDGTHLEEKPAEATEVPASEWADFPQRLEQRRKELEANLEET